MQINLIVGFKEHDFKVFSKRMRVIRAMEEITTIILHKAKDKDFIEINL
jgi:hypothetical protein